MCFRSVAMSPCVTHNVSSYRPPFSRQVGPLLTALLLAGRIGGSYAGEIATMQATNQVGSHA